MKNQNEKKTISGTLLSSKLYMGHTIIVDGQRFKGFKAFLRFNKKMVYKYFYLISVTEGITKEITVSKNN